MCFYRNMKSTQLKLPYSSSHSAASILTIYVVSF
jgi:hypothetical protein